MTKTRVPLVVLQIDKFWVLPARQGLTQHLWAIVDPSVCWVPNRWSTLQRPLLPARLMLAIGGAWQVEFTLQGAIQSESPNGGHGRERAAPGVENESDAVSGRDALEQFPLSG